jgi:hypothetical protein
MRKRHRPFSDVRRLNGAEVMDQKALRADEEVAVIGDKLS